MKVNDIMKLGDVLHELDSTSDSVLNVIRVLRGIPGKDHDDDVDTLYRVYDDIRMEMERLSNGTEKAEWLIPCYDDEQSKYAVCSECNFTTNRIMLPPTKYCPNCGRLMIFPQLYSGGKEDEQTSEEKEDEESSN